MIAHITYTCLGSEDKTVSTTTVNIAPASGYVIIDVILNGYSQDFNTDVTVDEATGNLVFNSLLDRDDFIICLFKQLPRYGSSTGALLDFESADFESADFL